MSFGQNLKYLREINHVTQVQLANHLQVTRSTIAGYETKGKQPDYDKLRKIAAFFHVSIDFLLNGIQSDDSILPDYIVTKKINEHELKIAYHKLSKNSQQKLWDYMELLLLAEEHREDFKKEKGEQ